MNFDQYEEPSTEQEEFANAVGLLVAALYDEEGKVKDLSDKAGREALIRLISDIPKEIPAELKESDKKLLKDTIQECQETRKMMKTWFWWVVGLMFLASSTISLCAVMLFK